MGIFGNLGGSGRKHRQVSAQVELPLNGAAQSSKLPSRRSTGRTNVYAVRVRDTFKSDVRGLVVEIELERRKVDARARKVTEGEVMELMLGALNTARRNGHGSGYATSLADDVWRGATELGRHMQLAPADVIERLVVQKIVELGLLQRTK